MLKFVGVGLLIQLCESLSVSSGLLCCAEFVSLELLFDYAKVRQSWIVCSMVQKLDTGEYAWIARSAFQWVAQGSYGVFMSNGQFRLQKNKSNTFPGTAPGLNQSSSYSLNAPEQSTAHSLRNWPVENLHRMRLNKELSICLAVNQLRTCTERT